MSLLTDVPLTQSSRQSSGVGALWWVVGLSVPLLVGCASPDPLEPAAQTVTVLAEGSPLHGANGVMFGPDGRLYVASVASSVIAAVDSESGAIVEQWGPEEGVNGPDDLTFGPDVVRVVRPHFRGVLDVHLMCSRPEILLEPFAKAMASFFPSFFPAETVSLTSILFASINLDARVQLVQPLR